MFEKKKKKVSCVFFFQLYYLFCESYIVLFSITFQYILI